MCLSVCVTVEGGNVRQLLQNSEQDSARPPAAASHLTKSLGGEAGPL